MLSVISIASLSQAVVEDLTPEDAYLNSIWVDLAFIGAGGGRIALNYHLIVEVKKGMIISGVLRLHLVSMVYILQEIGPKLSHTF